MPFKLNPKAMFSFLAGITIGYFGMNTLIQLSNNSSGQISFASNKTDKLEHGSFASKALPSEQTKLSKPFQILNVQISSSSDIPEDSNQDVELIGTIKPLRAFNSPIEYSWHLPDGITVVAGDRQGQFNYDAAIEETQVRLIVRGFSQKDFQLITLQAFSMEGANRLGNSASITSKPEDSFEMLSNNDDPFKSLANEKASRKLSGELQR